MEHRNKHSASVDPHELHGYGISGNAVLSCPTVNQLAGRDVEPRPVAKIGNTQSKWAAWKMSRGLLPANTSRRPILPIAATQLPQSKYPCVRPQVQISPPKSSSELFQSKHTGDSPADTISCEKKSTSSSSGSTSAILPPQQSSKSERNNHVDVPCDGECASSRCSRSDSQVLKCNSIQENDVEAVAKASPSDHSEIFEKYETSLAELRTSESKAESAESRCFVSVDSRRVTSSSCVTSCDDSGSSASDSEASDSSSSDNSSSDYSSYDSSSSSSDSSASSESPCSSLSVDASLVTEHEDIQISVGPPGSQEQKWRLPDKIGDATCESDLSLGNINVPSAISAVKGTKIKLTIKSGNQELKKSGPSAEITQTDNSRNSQRSKEVNPALTTAPDYSADTSSVSESGRLRDDMIDQPSKKVPEPITATSEIEIQKTGALNRSLTCPSPVLPGNDVFDKSNFCPTDEVVGVSDSAGNIQVSSIDKTSKPCPDVAVNVTTAKSLSSDQGSNKTDDDIFTHSKYLDVKTDDCKGLCSLKGDTANCIPLSSRNDLQCNRDIHLTANSANADSVPVPDADLGNDFSDISEWDILMANIEGTEDFELECEPPEKCGAASSESRTVNFLSSHAKDHETPKGLADESKVFVEEERHLAMQDEDRKEISENIDDIGNEEYHCAQGHTKQLGVIASDQRQATMDDASKTEDAGLTDDKGIESDASNNELTPDLDLSASCTNDDGHSLSHDPLKNCVETCRPCTLVLDADTQNNNGHKSEEEESPVNIFSDLMEALERGVASTINSNTDSTVSDEAERDQETSAIPATDGQLLEILKSDDDPVNSDDNDQMERLTSINSSASVEDTVQKNSCSDSTGHVGSVTQATTDHEECVVSDISPNLPDQHGSSACLNSSSLSPSSLSLSSSSSSTSSSSSSSISSSSSSSSSSDGSNDDFGISSGEEDSTSCGELVQENDNSYVENIMSSLMQMDKLPKGAVIDLLESDKSDKSAQDMSDCMNRGKGGTEKDLDIKPCDSKSDEVKINTDPPFKITKRSRWDVKERADQTRQNPDNNIHNHRRILSYKASFSRVQMDEEVEERKYHRYKMLEKRRHRNSEDNNKIGNRDTNSYKERSNLQDKSRYSRSHHLSHTEDDRRRYRTNDIARSHLQQRKGSPEKHRDNRSRKDEISEEKQRYHSLISEETSQEKQRDNKPREDGKSLERRRDNRLRIDEKSKRKTREDDHKEESQDAEGGRVPTGYCFVQFPTEDAAHQAMLRLNGKILPGSMPYKRFKLNHASFGREHLSVPEYSLFVGELATEVDDFLLYTHFKKKYNSIRSAKVVMGDDGVSRGYGFVRFTSENDQQKALTEMQHYSEMGGKPIRVSLATTKKPYSSTSTYNQQQNYSYQGNYDYYQQYQSYYNWGWPGYGAYQQGQQYPGYGAPGAYSVPPPPPTSTEVDTSQQPQQQQAETDVQGDDETPVDPELEIDVDKANKEFMERSEEFYQALEGSRWHPLDTVYSTVSATVK